MKKILLALLLLHTIEIKAQEKPNCDTVGLMNDLLLRQFGQDYCKYTIHDYKCAQKSDTLKKLVLRLLKKQWYKSDYMPYIKKRINNYTSYINAEALNIIKKDTSRYIQVRDSLEYEELKNIQERLLKSNIRGVIIQLAGYLYYKESISVLKKLLNTPNLDPQYIYHIQLSLARLGDTESENIIIKFTPEDTANGVNMGNKELDIYFIRSQKGYYKLSKLLNSTKEEYPLSEGDYKEKISWGLLRRLKASIINRDFQDYFNQKYKNKDIGSPDIDDKDIRFAIQWFEKNKGKYIIKEY